MNVAIPCICPARPDGEQRHPGDTVVLRETLDFRTMTVLRQTVKWIRTEDPDSSVPEVLAALSEAYVFHCIESWTLVDAKGHPVSVSRAAITALTEQHPDAAAIVGDEAETLYSERVLLPLLARGSTSSPPSSTNGSTSARTGSGPRPPKPSKPSSISTIPTAATAGTSTLPAGVSSSSLSSASAG